MAEDQAEPGIDSDIKSTKENKSEEPVTTLINNEHENQNLKDIEKQTIDDNNEKVVDEKIDKKEEVIEPVKQMHEDDAFEESQSFHLILEDTEDIEVPKFEDDDEDEKDIFENEDETGEKEKISTDNAIDQVENKEVKVDAGSSKIDNNEEKEIKKDEIISDTEKAKEELSVEKVTVEIKSKTEDKEIEVDHTQKEENEKKEEKEEKKEEEKPVEPIKDIKPSEDVEISKIKIISVVNKKQDIIEPEVGIVGPPTVASELLSDAELTSEKSTLPTDETKTKVTAVVSDRVVRWVEKTAATSKADDPIVAATDNEKLILTGEEEEEGIEEKEPNVADEEIEEEEEEAVEGCKRRTRKRKRKQSNGTNGSGAPATRKSQKVVTNIIRRSIRCLNKMHAMENSSGNGNKAVDSAEESKQSQKQQRDDEDQRKSPKVPQSQQNGAALPEETASSDRNLLYCQTTSSPNKKDKKEVHIDRNTIQQQAQTLLSKSSKPQPEQTSTQTTTSKPSRASSQRNAVLKLQQQQQQQQQQLQMQQQQDEHPVRETRKRRSAETSSSNIVTATSTANLSSNGNSTPKKLCLDQREQFISSLIGSEKFTAEQLAVRAEQLRAEVQDLDELARAKEMEWNEILSMRKLKEEAYLRIERRRQIMGFMESNGSLHNDNLLPAASLVLAQQNYDGGGSSTMNVHCKDNKPLIVPKEERGGSVSRDSSPAIKRERASKIQSNYQQAIKQQHQQHSLGENGPKQIVDAQSPEHRQIGEGRQGPIVDVRSIIADYRLRHPETVPRRRGRRMRNSVNVGLGAGGAMVETVGNIDSRPSSTDSCKSNSNVSDPNNAMSFKDVLVQFAKLSQQQGEPIKTPQNYPDVTLHPVAAAPTTQNSAPQTSGSLLHGILTKSQSPRPTTFSPTLARLLTAPERERSAPTITATPHQTTTQHLLQAYQGANPVSISDFLSSSKARTEITITPVNNPIQTHSNNLIHVDEEDETSIIEERDSRLSIGTRDNRDDRDTPPRCQGCHERAAQFVCAGCGNQWYCSRECQVAAWDDHSEVCSG